jgi:hypothetical protein
MDRPARARGPGRLATMALTDDDVKRRRANFWVVAILLAIALGIYLWFVLGSALGQ